MCFLKFILLLLIPSYVSGGCQSSISVSGGQNVFCSGQDFNLTCQFACHGQQNHVQLLKEQQIVCREESLNNSITLSVPFHRANRNDSGTYSCQTEPVDSISMAYVEVKDCVLLPKSTNITSSSSTTTHQSPIQSRTLAPVLMWYMLFKTGVFIIGSITAVLKVRSTEK